MKSQLKEGMKVEVKFAVLGGYETGEWKVVYKTPDDTMLLPQYRDKVCCTNGSGRFMHFDYSEIMNIVQ